MTKKQKLFFDKKEKQIAENFIEAIRSGKAGFMKPSNDALPCNAITGKGYTGVNVCVLLMANKPDPRWVTFKKALENGFTVKKGAKAMPVRFFQPVSDEDMKKWINSGSNPLEQPFPAIKYYNVFNADDIIGINSLEIEQIEVNKNHCADEIIEQFDLKINFDQSNKTAFYNADTDSIHMGLREYYDNDAEFYSIALHEIAHATGHSSRLNRDLFDQFGTNSYAFEELVAQLSSYMLSAYLGIPHNPGDSLEYVENWLNVLENELTNVKAAMKMASQVVDYLLSPELKTQITDNYLQMVA